MSSLFFYTAPTKEIKEGFVVANTSTVASVPLPTGTPAPTVPPDPYDPENALPLPFVPVDRNGRPLYSSGPQSRKALGDAIASNISEKNAQSCQQPPSFSTDDIFAKASDIAGKLGGDQVCTKKQDNYASTNQTSMSIKGQVDALFVSASMAAAASHSETLQSQKMAQSGCGSLMITATNVSSKTAQMQCIINNVTSTTSANAVSNNSISIQTIGLTDTELDALTKYQQQSQVIKENMTKEANNAILKVLESHDKLVKDAMADRQSCYQMAIAAGIKDVTQIKLLCDDSFNQIIKSKVDTQAILDFNTKAIELINEAAAVYQQLYTRNVNMKNTTINIDASTSVNVSTNLSTEQKSQLSTLAQSITKDVTAQKIANTFGTAVTDPNVKQATNKAIANQYSSASSSISNILSQTSVNTEDRNNIKLICPGSINLDGVKIDIKFVAKVAVSATLTQAVTNGIQAAAAFVSDTKNTQDIANKVSGLDDLQNALGKTNADAIKATGDAAALPPPKTSTIGYIIGGIVIIAILYFMFGGDGQQPMIVMQQPGK
jgi:hypothetical protein